MGTQGAPLGRYQPAGGSSLLHLLPLPIKPANGRSLTAAAPASAARPAPASCARVLGLNHSLNPLQGSGCCSPAPVRI